MHLVVNLIEQENDGRDIYVLNNEKPQMEQFIQANTDLTCNKKTKWVQRKRRKGNDMNNSSLKPVGFPNLFQIPPLLDTVHNQPFINSCPLSVIFLSLTESSTSSWTPLFLLLSFIHIEAFIIIIGPLRLSSLIHLSFGQNHIVCFCILCGDFALWPIHVTTKGLFKLRKCFIFFIFKYKYCIMFSLYFL